MPKIGMHEHIRYQLVNPKITGFKKMQAQNACQINIETAKSESSQKQQNIDYQQVLHHRW